MDNGRKETCVFIHESRSSHLHVLFDQNQRDNVDVYTMKVADEEYEQYVHRSTRHNNEMFDRLE
jgi:hypothetical protein